HDPQAAERPDDGLNGEVTKSVENPKDRARDGVEGAREQGQRVESDGPLEFGCPQVPVRDYPGDGNGEAVAHHGYTRLSDRGELQRREGQPRPSFFDKRGHVPGDAFPRAQVDELLDHPDGGRDQGDAAVVVRPESPRRDRRGHDYRGRLYPGRRQAPTRVADETTPELRQHRVRQRAVSPD